MNNKAEIVDNEEIIRLFRTLNNNSDVEIAKQLNIHVNRVCKIINEFLEKKQTEYIIFASKINDDAFNENI